MYVSCFTYSFHDSFSLQLLRFVQHLHVVRMLLKNNYKIKELSVLELQLHISRIFSVLQFYFFCICNIISKIKKKLKDKGHHVCCIKRENTPGPISK